MRAVAAITGVGEIAPVRYTHGVTMIGMLVDVAHRAMADAGLDPPDIDGLVVQSVPDAPFMGASVVAEVLGLRCSFLDQVDLGGASAGVMVVRAAAAVHAGLARRVLCLTAVPNEQQAPRPAGMPSTAAAGYKAHTPQGEWDVPLGATGGTFAYAFMAQATMRASALTSEHLWQVVESSRRAASRNPDALLHDVPITRADYDASPITCTPLREADSVVTCAGAGALVVEGAGQRAGHTPPVTILGVGEAHHHRSISQIPDLAWSPNALAAERAFAMAGLSPGRVEIANLYDAFSSLVPRFLAECGFVAVADVRTWMESHDLLDGPLPINAFGGLLGAGHAGAAAGMSLITALVRQLQGRAGPIQRRPHEVGFVNGTGGELSTNVALVLTREDP